MLTSWGPIFTWSGFKKTPLNRDIFNLSLTGLAGIMSPPFQSRVEHTMGQKTLVNGSNPTISTSEKTGYSQATTVNDNNPTIGGGDGAGVSQETLVNGDMCTVKGSDGDKKLLIIGAGSTGLALAQGLKKAGIPYVVYERDATAIRSRNWSMGIHWAVPALEELLPDGIIEQFQWAQTDPNKATNDSDRLPFINGATGELIMEIKSHKFYRFRRDKLRKLLLEGIDVRWGKSLSNIKYSEDGMSVTASFADGTQDTGSLLIGTDGPHSAVRNHLLGPERAEVVPIDYATTFCFSKHTREHALFLRARPHHSLYQTAPHPSGNLGWLSLHDGDDPEHPENWTFFHYISYPEPRNYVNTKTKAEHLAYQRQLASHFTDPFRSVFDWMPDDSQVWYSKLRQWDPSEPGHQWDNRNGRVTIAGDAAHPMTFQRGQGLNHAIKDALEVFKAIESFWDGGNFGVKEREAALKAYEEEMIPRGGEEVRMSEKNCVHMHNWEKVMESPSVKKGMNVKPEEDATAQPVEAQV